ncbi:ribonuclease HII [Metabacillus sp. Hm71]|uniref:ribonuclease HII n=1 Tax=Metabacillus sp. Hm71 TaxID=3450743 RepID=UPI003F41FF1F
MNLTIKEIQDRITRITNENDPFLEQCKDDSRKGVQQLVQKWWKHYEQEKALQEQFYGMLSYERKAHAQGFHLIAGVDEVGRGPLAGPVVAAAVILKEECYIPGLTDSKKLTAAMREKYFDLIKTNAKAIGIGIVQAEVIDEINIYEATKLAMKQAIKKLEIEPDYLLLDAMKLELPISQESIIKGDAKSVSIAASSVIAKVTRDRFMQDLAKRFPEYGFEQHMGYGTRYHLDALQRHGVTEYHRKSYAPVKDRL